MKKLLTILLSILMVLGLTSCAKKLPEQYDEETLLNTALQTIELANAYDYEAIASMVREDLYTDTLVDQIEEGWGPMLEKAGAYKKHTQYQTTASTGKDGYEYAVIAVACEYENDTLIYTLSYDEDYKLVSLYMK